MNGAGLLWYNWVMDLATKKTRKLTNEQFRRRLIDGCPHCSARLVDRARMKEDRSGKSCYAGSFFGCSRFGRGCPGRYSVNLDGTEHGWPRDGELDAAAE